jgi:nucleoside-diphosphate-sugar epimerase
MRVLVTGANGFVGSVFCASATSKGFMVQGATRNVVALPGIGDSIGVGSIGEATNWQSALLGMSHVVHLAARVHVMTEIASDPLIEFRRVNVLGTLNLARQAAAMGVRRFVFISSIKVNGEATKPGFVYTIEDEPAPEDGYSISKAEAEAGLQQLAQDTGMEVVIIRSPLVYGLGVKGSFRSLINVVARGFPLPLGAVTNNRRSLVALDNLVDLILTCLVHMNAANQTFLVSDCDDLSTAELLRRIGKALNKPARLFPIPVVLLTTMACFLGKRAIAQRLFGSLQVDISKTIELLDWKPTISIDEGLTKAVEQRV